MKNQAVLLDGFFFVLIYKIIPSPIETLDFYEKMRYNDKNSKKPMTKRSTLALRRHREPQAVELRHGERKEWTSEGERTRKFCVSSNRRGLRP